MKDKMIGSICLVLAIIIIVTSGTSYAYFSASTSSSGDDITGETYNFDVDLSISTIYKAEQLVPLTDTLIDEAINKSSNKCIDNKGYEVCSLYQVKLINNGDAQILNGFINTTKTTYTTDNLRCQLFDSNYNKVSDVMTITHNNSGKIYFKNGTNNVTTELNSSDVTYYLAIWLHETNDYQNDDYAKTFSGSITFESLYGEQISANFTS